MCWKTSLDWRGPMTMRFTFMWWRKPAFFFKFDFNYSNTRVCINIMKWLYMLKCDINHTRRALCRRPRNIIIHNIMLRVRQNACQIHKSVVKFAYIFSGVVGRIFARFSAILIGKNLELERERRPWKCGAGADFS